MAAILQAKALVRRAADKSTKRKTTEKDRSKLSFCLWLNAILRGDGQIFAVN